MSEWNELHPQVQQVLTSLGVDVSEITQAVGDASASAGYHFAEGYIDGHGYSSCVDLRAADPFWSRDWASRAYAANQVPFFRTWIDGMSPHIHMVSIGLRDQRGQVCIRPGPRMQIIDFTRGLNGLVGHGPIRPPFTPTVVEMAQMLAAYQAWAPGVRTKVFEEDGRWIPCYAFLDVGKVRCEARALVEGIEPGRFGVAWMDGRMLVRDTRSGDMLEIDAAHPLLEGAFIRADVRGLVEALPGWRLKSFELHDDGEWAEIIVAQT